MKKWLIISVVALVGIGAVYRESLMDVAMAELTRDMFVDSDADTFDPGLPVGSSFPEIRARYQNVVIKDIEPHIRDKGMIFVAVRSVDW
ncbi:MAG: hypothetical protein ACI9GW_002246 [Halieaceae bacterium]|jgi:hypothetical protein